MRNTADTTIPLNLPTGFSWCYNRCLLNYICMNKNRNTYSVSLVSLGSSVGSAVVGSPPHSLTSSPETLSDSLEMSSL